MGCLLSVLGLGPGLRYNQPILTRRRLPIGACVSTLNRLLVLVLALAVCLPLAPAPPALSQTPPSLRLTPDRLTLDPGATGVLELRAQAVQDLAAFEADLAFDPTVVAVERVERVIGTEAQPTPSRGWSSLPTSSDAGYIQLGAGRVSFGAYSYGTDNPPGAQGDAILARLTVRAVRSGQSSLRLTRALLANTEAQATTPTTSDGLVVVTGAGYSLFLPYLAASQPSRVP